MADKSQERDSERAMCGAHRPTEFSRRKWTIIAALAVSDVVALSMSAALATYLRFETFNARLGIERLPQSASYYEAMWAFVALAVLALWREGLYDLERLTWGAGEFSRIARATALAALGFVLLSFWLKLPGLSRAWLLLVTGISFAVVSIGRLVVRTVLRALRRRGVLLRTALIVGSNPEAAEIARILRLHPEAGLRPVGCLASSHAEFLPLTYCDENTPMLGEAQQLREVVAAHAIDTAIIATTAFDHEIVSRMIAELRDTGVTILLSSGLFDILTSRVLVKEVAGVPLISVRSVSFSPQNAMIKRAFDLVMASAIVVAGMPLWLLIAAAIRIDSPGPVLFKQERVGRGGRRFLMYKFRSMFRDAEERLAEVLDANEADGPLFKMKDDPRVTRVGKWLRRYSIDEFPQLLNVLKGEMSLVGPRPPLPRETEAYSERDWQRMQVLPGMTGLWQVSGRSHLTFEEMVRLDLFYIENWSVTFDLALMLRTIPVVLGARGAW
ncbi:sugar transferase [Coriobacteriia bacterium Es71-Z0120]|uniref:sugar transferase n=1 Tax=Parvivirga hydrogeniphila TaxID=2939460 RepID=UPI0022608E12|nr:sugar transferase [Parvivirga hydrogeniphila]MCL4079022.1 sugar transferase [Parvivirga hydrogeniphila]